MFNTKSAVFNFFFFPGSRKIFGSLAIHSLCFKSFASSKRDELENVQWKTDFRPNSTSYWSLIWNTYKLMYISVVLGTRQNSGVSVKRCHLRVLSARFWFVCVSILAYWFLPSSAPMIGGLLNAVPFVLLYLYLLLIHNPFAERSHFWIMWWTILMKKID